MTQIRPSRSVKWLLKRPPAQLISTEFTSLPGRLRSIERVVEIYRESLDQELNDRQRAAMSRRLILAGHRTLEIKDYCDRRGLLHSLNRANVLIDDIIAELGLPSIQHLEAAD